MYFNPHSHEGSDNKDRAIKGLTYNFNPHSHEGSDVVVYNRYINGLMSTKDTQTNVGTRVDGHVVTVVDDFNPHSHEGSDWLRFLMLWPLSWFQSTLPRREWQYPRIKQKYRFEFQSTLPRREWQQLPFYLACVTKISIHTPTKGVTSSGLSQLVLPKKFQSTLPRREWLKVLQFFHSHDLFQSTLPRREWRNYSAGHGKDIPISIHTPTKGVTRQGERLHTTQQISIHTPTKGVTSAGDGGGRQMLNFNPHSHEGSDRWATAPGVEI